MKTLTYRHLMTWFALFLGVHLIAQTDSVRTKQIPPYHAHRIILKYRTDPPHSVIKKNGRCLVQIREIDSLNVLYGCCHTRRMFPSALKNSEGLHMDRIFIFRFEKIENMDRLIKDYRDTGHFEYVEPDYTGKGGGRAELIPNDTYFNRQWSMKNDGTFPTSHPGTPDADIDMDEGWNITQGSNQIVGAILDTGCKMDHPEFSGRIWSNLNETASNGIDDDGNGYIDDIQGWDFAYDDNNPVDDHGHGTNVAGIVGATGNNDMGYAGVDWNCKLMIGKILNSENWGYYTWWMSAIEYVVNQGAHVINMSVGGASFSSGLQDAVNYAYQNNVVLCACMMNVNNSDPYYPAAYQNTIAVGATDTDDSRCNPFSWGGGSNWGSHIDVVAPGNIIYGLDHLSNTNYDWYWGGTSQATPHVTGLSALLKSQNMSRTVSDIRNILRSTAQDQVGNPGEDVAGFDVYHGYGRINAYQALTGGSPVEIPEQQARIFTMSSNYPNPFNPETTIRFTLENPGKVRFQIFDIKGRCVYQLREDYRNSGLHTITWDARDEQGNSMPTGTYIARLQAGAFWSQKKMILLR